MRPIEAYDKYGIKSEKNSVNDGLSTDKGRFAAIFNEYQNRYVEFIYERKNEDDIRYIQDVLSASNEIPYFRKVEDHYDFKLPSNYFDFSNVYGYASKGSCNNEKITLFEIKDFDKNLMLEDEFTKPSFEYRESLFTISSNFVNVYADDFVVDRIFLSYYKYPKQIQLVDPENPESDFIDMELDFDDKVIDRIISASVGGFELNNNSEAWQLHNLSSKTEL